MPATVVVGAQWGDEGKGKIVDLLAQEADVGFTTCRRGHRIVVRRVARALARAV